MIGKVAKDVQTNHFVVLNDRMWNKYDVIIMGLCFVTPIYRL